MLHLPFLDLPLIPPFHLLARGRYEAGHRSKRNEEKETWTTVHGWFVQGVFLFPPLLLHSPWCDP